MCIEPWDSTPSIGQFVEGLEEWREVILGGRWKPEHWPVGEGAATSRRHPTESHRRGGSVLIEQRRHGDVWRSRRGGLDWSGAEPMGTVVGWWRREGRIEDEQKHRNG